MKLLIRSIYLTDGSFESFTTVILQVLLSCDRM